MAPKKDVTKVTEVQALNKQGQNPNFIAARDITGSSLVQPYTQNVWMQYTIEMSKKYLKWRKIYERSI